MKFASLLALFAVGIQTISAHDFPRLGEVMPRNVDIPSIMPLIDTTNYSCFPSAAVSRQAKQNGGEKNEGAITGNCRNKKQFYDYSNTYHRYACKTSGNKKYCAHVFAFCFLKDQATIVGGGHRHAFDHVIVWTTDGKVTHGSTAALGPKAAADIPKDGQRLKFVYYKTTNHSFRFAKNGEAVQNPYCKYVSLAVDSWYPLPGAIIDGLNKFDYSPAVMPIKNSIFLTNINKSRPTGYPQFDQASVNNSQ